MKKLHLLLTGILLTMILSSCTHDPLPFDETRWLEDVKKQESDKLYAAHFRDGKYFNPWMPMEHGSFLQLLKWKITSAFSSYTEVEKTYLPAFIPELRDRIRSVGNGDFIAWVGHGTFLMRFHGEYWLTDPIFSERSLIPKRDLPPALTVEELKALTGRVNVIISHNHYDHLDAKSIRSLPAGTRFFVPLGLKDYVRSLHPGEVSEMDWWDTVEVGDRTKLTCLPAQHWSRRVGQGTNRTLWASFLLAGPTASVYFGGDSGSFVGFEEFGRRFPGIDYALLPTTAYHPRWFMHYSHMNVQEALEAFRSLGARWFIPTEWGTFPLGDEPPGYPALELRRMIKEKNLDPSRFIIMDVGEIKTVGRKQ